jgi:hypothetical protein
MSHHPDHVTRRRPPLQTTAFTQMDRRIFCRWISPMLDLVDARAIPKLVVSSLIGSEFMLANKNQV